MKRSSYDSVSSSLRDRFDTSRFCRMLREGSNSKELPTNIRGAQPRVCVVRQDFSEERGPRCHLGTRIYFLRHASKACLFRAERRKSLRV
jgi:hypothetical protein